MSRYTKDFRTSGFGDNKTTSNGSLIVTKSLCHWHIIQKRLSKLIHNYYIPLNKDAPVLLKSAK